jgi:hypothetical protein
MDNEWLFILMTAVELTMVVIAWRLGKVYLIGLIVANIILTSTFAPKLMPVFGLITNVSNVFYAGIFIATDILTEHHGPREGYRSVWVGFVALLLFMIMSQLVLIVTPSPEALTFSQGLEAVFAATPRIAAASFIAYAIAQSVDVWLYHKLREVVSAKHLWIPNNGSTLVSQLVDSVIFFTLAFAGQVPTGVLLNIIFTGYLLKVIVAILDTPCIYLSYFVRGLPLDGSVRAGDVENREPIIGKTV